jgi:Peptidase inhibitor I78 family
MHILPKFLFAAAMMLSGPALAHKAPVMQPPITVPGAAPITDSCASGDVEHLISQASAEIADLHSLGRVWFPGSVGTMDFQPQRRNIHVDEFGIITRVTCG